jgi:hypothetical protein
VVDFLSLPAQLLKLPFGSFQPLHQILALSLKIAPLFTEHRQIRAQTAEFGCHPSAAPLPICSRTKENSHRNPDGPLHCSAQHCFACA